VGIRMWLFPYRLFGAAAARMPPSSEPSLGACLPAEPGCAAGFCKAR
jgi:hypothetical protein